MYSYQLVFESNEYVSFQMFVKALRDINDANGSSLKTIEKQIRQTYLVEVRRSMQRKTAKASAYNISGENLLFTRLRIRDLSSIWPSCEKRKAFIVTQFGPRVRQPGPDSRPSGPLVGPSLLEISVFFSGVGLKMDFDSSAYFLF